MSDPTSSPTPDAADASSSATAPTEAAPAADATAVVAPPSTSEVATKDTGADLMAVLSSRGYRGLLVVSAVIGVPVALVAWGFLVITHELENAVWTSLPKSLGMSQPTWWYGLIVLAVAGLLVGVTISKLPGTGGHIPAHGLGGGQPLPQEMPAIVIAAIVSLVLGAVVGPEAPLVAIGSGAVVVALHKSRVGAQPQALQLLAVAGSAAAISTIFGNPVIGAVLILEVVGFAGSQVLLVLLPAVMAAGIGALVFTGLGNWTGFAAPTLTIPNLTSSTVTITDLLWTVPVSIVVALLAQAARRTGVNVAGLATKRPVAVTTAVGVVVGASAAVYALVTGRPITDVLFSGESALGPLVSNPQSWATGTLLALVLFKGIAYAVSLGAFRGGPTFPALFIGAAIGMVLGSLPGFGTTAGIAVGMAAGTAAVLRLPITSIVLVTLLLGTQALSEIPIVMVAAVVGLVTAVSLDRKDSIRPLKFREARAAKA